MKIAYFDCFSGAAGDMIVGALLDAGADADALREGLSNLGVSGFSLSVQRVDKQSLAATRFCVQLDPDLPQPHRHLRHILEILDASTLSDRVRGKAAQIFRRLAEAEAKVHGTTIEKIHFHEVGAVDAIVDVVGSLLALDLLGVDRIVCSPIPTGSGTISCQHGVLPVPAPATAELLKGIPLMACDEVGELTTPTGAAILTTVADEFGPLPPMSLAEIGYGAGTRDGGSRPNVLRVLIGHSVEAGETDEITVLETNLDDASPELVGYCMERLMSEGALDAYVVPIQMKKSRPGVLLTVLCEQQRVAALEQVLFAETTTFGIRRQRVVRVKMTRRHETVSTRFGTVRVKVGSRDGVQTVSPEYEDCRALAEQRGAPLREVVAAASAAWRALSDAPGGVGKQP